MPAFHLGALLLDVEDFLLAHPAVQAALWVAAAFVISRLLRAALVRILVANR